MYQQHNYLQTVMFGVDAALRSNEFYPHRPDRAVRRAGSFMPPEPARYLTTAEDSPFCVADDITDPVTDVDYALRFLPQPDAF